MIMINNSFSILKIHEWFFVKKCIRCNLQDTVKLNCMHITCFRLKSYYSSINFNKPSNIDFYCTQNNFEAFKSYVWSKTLITMLLVCIQMTWQGDGKSCALICGASSFSAIIEWFVKCCPISFHLLKFMF